MDISTGKVAAPVPQGDSGTFKTRGTGRWPVGVERKLIDLSPELRPRGYGEGESSNLLRPRLRTPPQVFSGEHSKLDSVSLWILTGDLG